MSTECNASPAPSPAESGRFSHAAKRRLRGTLVLAGCVGALWVAWYLGPAEAGQGTHRQLGLPDCSILIETGWPCPSCGLTTSVSALVHGRIGLSLRANVFGVVIVAALVAGSVVGLAEMATGLDLFGKARPGVWWIVVFGAGVLAGWAVKLLIGWLTGQLPIH